MPLRKLLGTTPEDVRKWAEDLYEFLNREEVVGSGMRVKNRQEGTVTVLSGATTGQKVGTDTVEPFVKAKSTLNRTGWESTDSTVFVGGRLALDDDGVTVNAFAWSMAAVAAILVIGYELIEYEDE